MKLLCYTRTPKEDEIYAARLAYSMHLAYETSEGFRPLNHNTGVLFVKATQNPETLQLIPKSLKNPRLCALPDGSYAVLAVRIEADGDEDASSRGKVVCFVTEDLLHYRELPLIPLCEDYIDEASLSVSAENLPELTYTVKGKQYKVAIPELLQLARQYREQRGTVLVGSESCEEIWTLSSVREAVTTKNESLSGKSEVQVCGEATLQHIEGIVPGNVIEVPDEVGERLVKKLLTPQHISTELPENLTVQNAEELSAVRAVCRYSDGSTAKKRIDWDLTGLDFTKPGEYEISGKLHQDHFAFPIALNRADPCIYRYKDWYYFIATNDADWNHTLYVRKAKTIPELVTAEESLILDCTTYPEVGGLLWAPEFHEVDGKLYIFHACTTKEFIDEQSNVMVFREGGDPADKNSWEAPRRVVKADGSPLMTGGITLDMTTFESGGNNYIVWSQRQFVPCDQGAWLYIATIDPKEPWRLTCEPVLLSMPEYGWQNNHTFVDEGPFALIRDGKIYLTFSSAAVDSTYCVGMFTAELGADLLKLENWTKTNYPLLTSASVEGEFGTGHNAYVEDEYGDIWNTYHARPGVDGPRSSGIRRVHFGFDGEPVLDMTEELDVNPKLQSVKMKVSVK